MNNYKKNDIVLIDNELFIVLKKLKNDKYKVQKILDKTIYIVNKFYISTY